MCVMKERYIKTAIELVVRNSRYSSWTIGITDNPNTRKIQHGNPKNWHHWRADTETMARNIEKYFIAKGMSGAPGGGETPNYVYIFR